jgi:hypothetical protein
MDLWKWLIIATFCFITLSQSCGNSYSFSNDASCVFNFNNPTGGCTNFTFINCTYSVCVLRSSKGVCYLHSTKNSTDWGYCTDRCCATTSSLPQTWDTLNQCQKNATNLTIILACTIPGGIILIAIIVILCCKKGGSCMEGCSNCIRAAGNCIINILTCKCLQRHHI